MLALMCAQVSSLGSRRCGRCSCARRTRSRSCARKARTSPAAPRTTTWKSHPLWQPPPGLLLLCPLGSSLTSGGPGQCLFPGGLWSLSSQPPASCHLPAVTALLSRQCLVTPVTRHPPPSPPPWYAPCAPVAGRRCVRGAGVRGRPPGAHLRCSAPHAALLPLHPRLLCACRGGARHLPRAGGGVNNLDSSVLYCSVLCRTVLLQVSFPHYRLL